MFEDEVSRGPPYTRAAPLTEPNARSWRSRPMPGCFLQAVGPRDRQVPGAALERVRMSRPAPGSPASARFRAGSWSLAMTTSRAARLCCPLARRAAPGSLLPESIRRRNDPKAAAAGTKERPAASPRPTDDRGHRPQTAGLPFASSGRSRTLRIEHRSPYVEAPPSRNTSFMPSSSLDGMLRHRSAGRGSPGGWVSEVRERSSASRASSMIPSRADPMTERRLTSYTHSAPPPWPGHRRTSATCSPRRYASKAYGRSASLSPSAGRHEATRVPDGSHQGAEMLAVEPLWQYCLSNGHASHERNHPGRGQAAVRAKGQTAESAGPTTRPLAQAPNLNHLC